MDLEALAEHYGYSSMDVTQEAAMMRRAVFGVNETKQSPRGPLHRPSPIRVARAAADGAAGRYAGEPTASWIRMLRQGHGSGVGVILKQRAQGV